ncbi:MAG: hypothetical protein WCW27_00125 [Patescibacteria group bacterium]|jgi:hypothetical protein
MRYYKVVLVLLLFAITCSAQAIDFDPAKNDSGLTSITKLTFLSGGANRDPATIAFSFINMALGFLGFISMVLLLYAGVLWFKAGENEEELTKAKDIIKGALIGLVLALGALSISTLVFIYVQNAAWTK